MAANARNAFFKEYAGALREDAAAMFVGAGLSVAAGYVDWKNLLKEIADDLGLDISRESDLVELAQFHVNQRHGRDRLNQLLIDHFLEKATLTPNHHLIASLPIRAVWTTNYDDLIERAFEKVNKRVDVKRHRNDFANNRRNPDVTVYKMHGDKSAPAEAIIVKEDYETYGKYRELFTIALKGDLVTKTFLFVGISFADPNVKYILAGVRHLLEENARHHYCLIKKPQVGECGADDYLCKRFDHWLADLHRYKIIPVVLDSYDEVTEILTELNRRCHLRDIFISGSAHDYSPLGTDKFHTLCRVLSSELIRQGFNVISGFGLGVGDMVIVGATESLQRNDDERLQLWPFPQTIPTGVDRTDFWRQYRERMISQAGVCIVLAGNKYENGTVVPANGVRQEIEIARKLGKIVLPIGATGHVAREEWDKIKSDIAMYFKCADATQAFGVLGDENAGVESLVKATIDILKQLDR